MKLIQRIKNWIKKGGYALAGDKLVTINDHPKVNIDPNELERIERNFDHYKGKYPMVEYVNSNGDKRKRNYMTLNMTKQSAELLASLVFNEQCEINISDADDKGNNGFQSAHDFITHVFEHNDFKKNLMKYLEPMFATGGLTVRPYVNGDNDEVEFSWALADAFYPLQSNTNKISEGVMKSVTTKIERGETTYYTLLEFHEWESGTYVITNELYKSEEKGVIGRRVPLSDLYEDLEEQATVNDLSQPIFNYVAPAGFNNINPHSPLGLGLTDNIKDTLKQINDTFDQFNWEVQMGQRTVIVSDRLLHTLPSEDGTPPKQVFDPNTNVFKAMPLDMDSELVKDITHNIRTEQYTSAINQSLKTLEMQLQLSVGTFSFDGRSVKTATEIVSENSLTYRTRNMHVNEVEKFIKGLIVSVLELAQVFDLYQGEIPTFEDIGVDFDDGIFTDKKQQLQFYGQAKQLGLVPNVEAIKRVFQLPEEVAEEWDKRIMQDQTEVDPMFIQQQDEEELYGEEE